MKRLRLPRRRAPRWMMLGVALSGCEGAVDSGLGPPPTTGKQGGAPCVNHGECLSRVCALDPGATRLDRQCAPPADVRYIQPGASCLIDGDGTVAQPWCSLKKAVGRVVGRQVLRLLPGEHEPVAMDQAQGERAVAIYGSDGSEGDWLASTTYMKAQTDGAALVLQGAGFATLDAVTLEGGQSAVVCHGDGVRAPRLGLWRSTIQGSSAAGLRSDGCELTLREVTVQHNRDGAILLRSTTYSISDSQFIDNHATAEAAVRLSSDSQGLATAAFQRNAVLRNTVTHPAIAGGLDCGEGPLKPLSQLHLCGNSQDRRGAQASTSCLVLDALPCP